MTRQRRYDELRPVRIQRAFTRIPYGSVLISMGETRVLCTASVVKGVPPWLEGKGEGWVTAEYGMLPGSTPQRGPRNRTDGRVQEIQRLVGRSLRAVVDRKLLGEHTVYLDCDVLQADGGTRTAAITGSCVALHDALTRMEKEGRIAAWPMTARVAAVSVGVVDGKVRLDLDYALDSAAEVDMNVVMTSRGAFVEVQGTAERGTFDEATLSRMLKTARKGIVKLFEIQGRSLKSPGRRREV